MSRRQALETTLSEVTFYSVLGRGERVERKRFSCHTFLSPPQKGRPAPSAGWGQEGRGGLCTASLSCSAGPERGGEGGCALLAPGAGAGGLARRRCRAGVPPASGPMALSICGVH